ncbi:MAG: HAD hydrolase-like protein, partial [Candidatus Nanosynbacter sp.]|nr:HAD hydrolase-like protein [Candidatus Nanosynbacter sp.]
KADIIKQTIDNPEDSIIVGDTEADVAAAQQLNATSIALLSGIRSKKFLKSMEPDYLVAGIGDIANINF